MKPRIGITSFVDSSKPRGRYVAVNVNYTRSVAMAGGLPLVLPVCPELDDPLAFLEGIDGLLISGGVDLASFHYGQEPVRGLGSSTGDRDGFELALVRAAVERRLPVFGICRGHQLVNVALGGDLWQDLAAQRPSSIEHRPPEGQDMDELRHSVSFLPAARIFRLEGRDGKVLVNSFHHQAVKELAPGLVATALAPDGIIEAFEGQGDSWILGLQLHPEALTLRWPEFLAPFSAHVEAAARHAAR